MQQVPSQENQVDDSLQRKFKSEIYQKNNQNIKIVQDQEDELYNKNMLTPANPIINKNKSPDQYVNFKLIDLQRQNVHKKDRSINPILRKSKKYDSFIQQTLEQMNLYNGYDQANILFKKFQNSDLNQMNKKKYFSSIFFPISLRQNGKFQMSIEIPIYQGMKKNQNILTQCSLIQNIDQQLQFSSNFQSGNLFAVYKTGPYNYDLVLQNDINTTGCTQWFYFKVNNKKNKDIIAKFNIINMYKSSSLYSRGMKPMVLSAKSSKGWKRKGQNIFYQKNLFKRQGSKKYYSSLSFSYDFTKQNDSVEFTHAVPYTYTRLLEFLKTIETSKKCIIKSLGTTPLKKSIPIIKFESQDLRIQKKSIIIMARQHPGQVQGSFAVEQILNLLIKPSTQIQFLLWRFNIYIIPMINVDGVAVGNYRSNAMGYDLNRNWDGQQKSKQPEIVYIKNQIKKIMLKYPIELILDLHGHSNKMNSFFYGNSFGPNPFVFPFIASKQNSFVSFQDCTFTIQTKQKAKTARSVLGNMIKQTGNVYTYQMSFYGGQKNGKVINFYQQNFKDLGKDLLNSMYKVFIESYKEEKTLKQSLYLKQIRKQLSKIEGQFSQKGNDSGSDSEAQQQRQQMEKQKNEHIQQKLEDLLRQKQRMGINLDEMQNLRKSQKMQESCENYDQNLSRLPSFTQRKTHNQYEDNSIKQRLKRDSSLIDQKIKSHIYDYDESLNQKIKKHKIYSDKLKIYGQNFLTKPNLINKSQQYHTIENKTQKFIQKLQKSVRNSSVFQNQIRFNQGQENFNQIFYINKKHKNRSNNFSTLSPTKQEWKQDEQLIKDIVKVNRLEYKKIQRQKDKFKFKKNLSKSNSRNQGIFKLPSIINDFKH